MHYHVFKFIKSNPVVLYAKQLTTSSTKSKLEFLCASKDVSKLDSVICAGIGSTSNFLQWPRLEEVSSSKEINGGEYIKKFFVDQQFKNDAELECEYVKT